MSKVTPMEVFKDDTPLPLLKVEDNIDKDPPNVTFLTDSMRIHVAAEHKFRLVDKAIQTDSDETQNVATQTIPFYGTFSTDSQTYNFDAEITALYNQAQQCLLSSPARFQAPVQPFSTDDCVLDPSTLYTDPQGDPCLPSLSPFMDDDVLLSSSPQIPPSDVPQYQSAPLFEPKVMINQHLSYYPYDVGITTSHKGTPTDSGIFTTSNITASTMALVQLSQASTTSVAMTHTTTASKSTLVQSSPGPIMAVTTGKTIVSVVDAKSSSSHISIQAKSKPISKVPPKVRPASAHAKKQHKAVSRVTTLPLTNHHTLPTFTASLLRRDSVRRPTVTIKQTTTPVTPSSLTDSDSDNSTSTVISADTSHRNIRKIVVHPVYM